MTKPSNKVFHALQRPATKIRVTASFACRSIITFKDQLYILFFTGRAKNLMKIEISCNFTAFTVAPIQCAAVALLRKYLLNKTRTNLTSLFTRGPSLVQVPGTCGQTCLTRSGFPCGGCSKDLNKKNKKEISASCCARQSYVSSVTGHVKAETNSK